MGLFPAMWRLFYIESVPGCIFSTQTRSADISSKTVGDDLLKAKPKRQPSLGSKPIGSASLARSIRIWVPLSPPHWPHPKRIRPPSWPRVAVASSTQNTKLFTWHTWPGAGAVPKCDWASRSQCGHGGSKERHADHTKYMICCDSWPICYHYWTDDCINMNM